MTDEANNKYRIDNDRRVVTSYKGDTIAPLHQYNRHFNVLHFIDEYR